MYVHLYVYPLLMCVSILDGLKVQLSRVALMPADVSFDSGQTEGLAVSIGIDACLGTYVMHI